jgi:hypothetical protein
MTGMDEEAWQLKQLDMAAVRKMYKDVLAGSEALVVAALKRGEEQLLDTLAVRCDGEIWKSWKGIRRDLKHSGCKRGGSGLGDVFGRQWKGA